MYFIYKSVFEDYEERFRHSAVGGVFLNEMLFAQSVRLFQIQYPRSHKTPIAHGGFFYIRFFFWLFFFLPF